MLKPEHINSDNVTAFAKISSDVIELAKDKGKVEPFFLRSAFVYGVAGVCVASLIQEHVKDGNLALTSGELKFLVGQFADAMEQHCEMMRAEGILGAKTPGTPKPVEVI